MARAAEGAPRVTVRSRADLRVWLADNHGEAGTQWLVTFRKPSPEHLPYREIVEELPLMTRARC
jgi:hypothetical protein